MRDAVVVAVAATVAVVATVHYVRHHRGRSPDTYSPRAAWTRAAIYFSCCWIASVLAGTFDRIVEEPFATADQLADGGWWAWTAASLAVIVAGYPVVWARWTLTFDRPSRPLPQALFGLVWGSATGQLLATAFVLAERTGWPRWGVWLLAWALVGMWQGGFQDLFWDVYVTPEHDTPTTITRKVLVAHVPNVTVTLTHLVLHGNVALFVALQCLALVSASVAMRLPVFWETRPVRAATTGPGPFGLRRCVGYQTDDPHPYLTQRLARRAARTTGAPAAP